MSQKQGAFRFTYFTDKYQETYAFYQDKLGFELAHDWDRRAEDKGALFKAGFGLIEILHKSLEETENPGLDYRAPQGIFMCIQVWEIDDLYDLFKKQNIPFKQELTDQSWGHRTFSILEPNGLTLYFFQENF